MINALIGPSQNVNGRIIAIVVSGPMPGNTPIAVPIRQPMKHRAMFCHVSATPKPIAILPMRPENRSGALVSRLISEDRRPKRDGHVQRKDEDADIGDNHDGHQHRHSERPQ